MKREQETWLDVISSQRLFLYIILFCCINIEEEDVIKRNMHIPFASLFSTYLVRRRNFRTQSLVDLINNYKQLHVKKLKSFDCRITLQEHSGLFYRHRL